MTFERAASVYDGFISYSHAADDLLAPRLQAGLQRFAKPWWKRRAVRMFRDESSLAANPDLWSSITEALDSSEWFVLLLSEDAASSDWVGREIEHWLAVKDSGRILPVVTSGEFGWENGDASGSSVPLALRGVFSEEPRWVDLRFAKGESQLDLKNPAFAAAVADISSAIRGIPKDELASEEVRQHRRTLRTAWAAGALVGVLGIAAVAFGIQSARNADDADEQRVIAEARATDAQEAAEEADRQRERAEENEADALREAALSEASRLVAAARVAMESDPELAVLLALEADATAPNGASDVDAQISNVLFDALGAFRLLARFPATDVEDRAVLSPDGNTIYHASGRDGAAWAINVETGLAHQLAGGLGARIEQLNVSPDGSTLVVALGGEGLAGDEPAELVVLGLEDDSQIRIPLGACHWASGWGSGFSPDGRYYAQFTGNAGCLDDGDQDWVNVYDTETWEVIREVRAEPAEEPTEGGDPPFSPGSLDGVAFTRDVSQVLVYGFYSKTEVLSFPDLEPLQPNLGTTLAAALAPSGNWIAVFPIDRFGVLSDSPLLISRLEPGRFGGLAVRELPTSTRPDIAGIVWNTVDRHTFDRDDPFTFSPIGDKIAVTEDGIDRIISVVHGDDFILGDYGATLQHSWSADASLLLTVSGEGWLLLWSASELTPFDLVRGGMDTDGALTYAFEVLTRGFTDGECTTLAVDPCPTLEEMLARWCNGHAGTSGKCT